MSRIEQLMEQRSLQEQLAQKQFLALEQKKAELELLEKKLRELEDLEAKQHSTLDGTIVTPALTTAQAAESVHLPQISKEEMMEELLKDERVREKMHELHRQSQELIMLETELSRLKSIKKDMKEKQDLMSLLTLQANQQDSTVTLAPIEEETDHNDNNEVLSPNNQDISQLNFDNLNEEESAEMERALLAMEQYLELLNKKSEAMTDKNDLESDSEKLEDLMQRLKDASLGKPNEVVAEKLAPIKEEVKEEDQQSIGDLKDNDDVVEVEKEQSIDETLGKVEFAILQIEEQLGAVKESEARITNDEERQYYDIVVSKLESQLQELYDIKEKMAFYKSILESEQTEESAPVREVQNTEEIEEIFVEETSVSAIKTPCIPKSAFENEMCKDLSSENIKTTIEFVPVFQRKEKFSSPTPSRATIMSSKKNETRSVRLFEKHRDAIYENASSLITSFQTKPHFLLSLFKKLKNFSDNEYAQQEILFTLDQLLEEQNADDFEDEYVEATKDGNFTESNLREKIHESIQTHVAAVVYGQNALEFFDSITIQDLAMHVNSIVYNHLTSSLDYENMEGDAALEVVERYRPVLQTVLSPFAGLQIKSNWNKLVKDINQFLDRVFNW